VPPLPATHNLLFAHARILAHLAPPPSLAPIIYCLSTLVGRKKKRNIGLFWQNYTHAVSPLPVHISCFYGLAADRQFLQEGGAPAY